jgi:hypothetical protein
MTIRPRTFFLFIFLLGARMDTSAAQDLPPSEPERSEGGAATAVEPSGNSQDRICVVVNRSPWLREEPVSVPHPPIEPLYVGRSQFYLNNETVVVYHHRYLKAGLPRRVPIGQLRRRGSYRDTSVFVARDEGDEDHVPDVIYLPVGPGCLFQPYQREFK